MYPFSLFRVLFYPVFVSFYMEPLRRKNINLSLRLLFSLLYQRCDNSNNFSLNRNPVSWRYELLFFFSLVVSIHVHFFFFHFRFSFLSVFFSFFHSFFPSFFCPYSICLPCSFSFVSAATLGSYSKSLFLFIYIFTSFSRCP